MQSVLLNRYRLLKGHFNDNVILGLGAEGQVTLAVDTLTNRHVAVKIIHRPPKNELRLHRKLVHPNIVRLLDYFCDERRFNSYLILEYAEEGNLLDKIRAEGLNKKQIKSYFRDICSAVAFMHESGVIHRDIKPENVVLKGGVAKLCDFGYASDAGLRKSICGTYEYMPPEIIQNKQYGMKIDIWALGILLFEMISGNPPFRGKTVTEVLNQMRSKIYFPDSFTTQQIDLIKFILRVSPDNRPSAKQILEHPYLASAASKQETRSTQQSEWYSGSDKISPKKPKGPRLTKQDVFKYFKFHKPREHRNNPEKTVFETEASEKVYSPTKTEKAISLRCRPYTSCASDNSFTSNEKAAQDSIAGICRRLSNRNHTFTCSNFNYIN